MPVEVSAYCESSTSALAAVQGVQLACAPMRADSYTLSLASHEWVSPEVRLSCSDSPQVFPGPQTIQMYSAAGS